LEGRHFLPSYALAILPFGALPTYFVGAPLAVTAKLRGDSILLVDHFENSPDHALTKNRLIRIYLERNDALRGGTDNENSCELQENHLWH